MHKKLLVIAYHFPPDLSVGAIRPAKLAKFLPKFGWQPIVLTITSRHHSDLDVGQRSENKGEFTIYKTASLPTFRDLYLLLKNTYLQARYNKKIDQKIKDWTPGKTSSHETAFDRVKRYFNSLAVWLPDDKIGWLLPAVLSALNICRAMKIDAIYTTSPPHSVQLIGMLLNRITRKPWISDFRDPWMHETKPAFVRSKFSEIIEAFMERQVILKSDLVVSVTREMTEAMLKRYPTVNNKKFITITNGYDPEDFIKYTSVEKYAEFTFTYAGSFYHDRNPRIFLSALSSLIKNNELHKGTIQVNFIGYCRYLYGSSTVNIEKMVEELNLKEVVTFIDFLPRKDVFEKMARSHVLLLLAANQPLQIPGKLYEYMGLRSYILAVCDNGATKQVLNSYPKSIVVRPNDLSKMKSAILALYENCSTSESQVSFQDSLKKFTHKDLVRNFVKLLDSIKQ